MASLSPTVTQAEIADRSAIRLVPAIVIALAASLGFIMVPVFVNLLRQGAAAFQPTEAQIGLLGSADPAGMFAGAAAALWLVKRFDLRLLATIALLGLVVCNLASIIASSFPTLLSLRLLAGCCGGLALATGLAQIGGTTKPDRNGAIFFCLQTLVGSALAALSGGAGTGGGIITVFGGMAFIGVFGLAACYVMTPQPPVPAGTKGLTDGRALWHLRFWTVCGNATTAAVFLIFWANIGAIADRHGFPPDATSLAISVGLIGGAVGSVFSIVTSGWFARRFVVTALFGCLFIGVALNLAPLPLWLFLVSAFILNFGTASTYYGFGALSEADRTGDLSIVHILTLKAGFAIGPAIASQIILFGGLQAIMTFSAIGFVIAWLFYLQLVRVAEGQSLARAA